MKKKWIVFILLGLTINVMSQKLTLLQFEPANSFDNPIAAMTYDGLLYLGINDGIHGNELFVLKEGEIKLIKDINSGWWGSGANKFYVLNHKLLFSAYNKFYALDNSNNQISVLSNNLQYPYNFVEFEQKLFFNAFQPGTGYELWMTNGDSIGTTMVKDIYEGGKLSDDMQFEVNSSNPQNLMVFKNELLFLAHSDKGWNIWTTKGSNASTEIKVNLKNSTLSMVDFNDKIFLWSYNNNSYELWTTDGTDLNTVLFKRIEGNSEGVITPPFKHYNKLFFFANDSVHGRELWVSDGTLEGTNMVKDIHSGEKSSLEIDGCHFVSLSEKYLLFVANDSINGTALWRTDGTEEGTTLVEDIFNDAKSYSRFSEFTKFGNVVVFSINKGIEKTEFWQTDGTALGTHMIGEIDNGTTMTLPHFLYSEDNKLYISGANTLWVCSDTTLTSIKGKTLNDISYYPNPVSESMYLTIKEPSTIKIMDLNGNIHFQRYYKEQFSNPINISFSNFKEGLYLLQVTSDQSQQCKKIIVKKKE